MDHESEVIRQQMEDTRTSLAEKLETLEQQVVCTVHGATNAVTDTVEAVREAVHDSVEKVKGSVEETMETVRETLDIQRQVERHPWSMFTGSVLLGYVGGSLLNLTQQERYRGSSLGPVYSNPDRGTTEGLRNGGSSRIPMQEALTSDNVQRAGGTEHHWLDEAGQMFEKEISKVKGLAIGTVLGVLRDLIANSLPEPLKPELHEVMDSVTTKLGGKPIQGPVLSEGWLNQPHTEEESGAHYQSRMGRPLGATCR
jgi:hypothetical protein